MTNTELLIQFDLAHELAVELFDGIWEDAAMWIQTPTDLFFGQSPAQVIISGDGHIVIEWLMVRSGKKPGAAF